MAGLFGGGQPAPIIRTPITPVEKPSTSSLDPDMDEGVAEARKKRIALKNQHGRSHLRTNLSIVSGPQRTGIKV